jgi:hypothetical protein
MLFFFAAVSTLLNENIPLVMRTTSVFLLYLPHFSGKTQKKILGVSRQFTMMQ